jgi:uncharacterized membrane protein
MHPARRFRWISLALALVLGTYTGEVFAQNSGGRFGGSRFGSSRSSSSSSSYRSSSSSSYRSSSGSSYRSSSGSSYRSSSGSSYRSSSSGSSGSSYRAPPPPPPRTRPADYRRAIPLAGTLLFSPTPRNIPGEESRLAHPIAANYYGPAKPLAGVATGTVVFGLLAGLTVLVTRPRKPSPGYSYAPNARPGPAPVYHPGWEVRRVSVALDWSVRAFVQKALAETSARFDMNTAHGLHGAASAARNCLLQYLAGARYGAFQSFAVAQHECEQRFGQMADGLRQRYLVETVNNARRVAMNATAQSEEGQGLVVVTLIVAVEGALPALPTTLDVPSLGNALGTLIPSNPERLLALEVVWSPSEENDRMSSAELETVYPELVRLAGDASPLGRRACSHCRAVYAGELGRCPACGAVG